MMSATLQSAARHERSCEKLPPPIPLFSQVFVERFDHLSICELLTGCDSTPLKHLKREGPRPPLPSAAEDVTLAAVSMTSALDPARRFSPGSDKNTVSVLLEMKMDED